MIIVFRVGFIACLPPSSPLARENNKHHQAVAQPYVQFEMTSGGERVSFTTHASKIPSGKNANFAERKVRTVLLPEDPLFAPQLCIRVGCTCLYGMVVCFVCILCRCMY